VELPNRVNVDNIAYARVAKKIDVIALKRALSDQIATAAPHKTPKNVHTEDGPKSETKEVSFRRLLQNIPSRLKDKRTLADLSVQV